MICEALSWITASFDNGMCKSGRLELSLASKFDGSRLTLSLNRNPIRRRLQADSAHSASDDRTLLHLADLVAPSKHRDQKETRTLCDWNRDSYLLASLVLFALMLRQTLKISL